MQYIDNGHFKASMAYVLLCRPPIGGIILRLMHRSEGPVDGFRRVSPTVSTATSLGGVAHRDLDDICMMMGL